MHRFFKTQNWGNLHIRDIENRIRIIIQVEPTVSCLRKWHNYFSSACITLYRWHQFFLYSQRFFKSPRFLSLSPFAIALTMLLMMTVWCSYKLQITFKQLLLRARLNTHFKSFKVRQRKRSKMKNIQYTVNI